MNEKVLSEHDRGWLEAAIDGEGSIYICKQRTQARRLRKSYTWSVRVAIYNTNQEFVLRAQKIVGQGLVYLARRGFGKIHPRGPTKALYAFLVTSNPLRELLPQLSLVIKEKHRVLALEALDLIRGNLGPGHYSQNDERLAQIHDQMKQLNHPGMGVEN